MSSHATVLWTFSCLRSSTNVNAQIVGVDDETRCERASGTLDLVPEVPPCACLKVGLSSCLDQQAGFLRVERQFRHALRLTRPRPLAEC